MSDLIDRQAAIDGKICIQRSNGVEIYDDYAVPVEYLEQLPPAQPERIKGRWVPADTLCGIKCSNCGYPVDDFCYSIDYIDLEYAPNFCPNCGADMREVTT